jgi:hypothetical protein
LYGRRAIPAVEVDDNRWPVVIITLSGEADRQAMGNLWDVFTALARRGQCGVIVDARELHGFSATLRAEYAVWMKEHFALLGARLLAFAIVVSSSMVRGFLVALSWRQAFPQPTEYVATLAEGEAFVLATLQQQGVMGGAESSLGRSMSPPVTPSA